MAERVTKSYEINWRQYQGIIDTNRDILWSPADSLDIERLLLWQQGDVLDALTLLRWAKGSLVDVEKILRWAKAQNVDPNILLAWAKTEEIDPNVILKWQKTAEVDPGIQLLWANVGAVDTEAVLRWGKSNYVDVENWIRWAKSATVDIKNILRWAKTKAIDVSTFSDYTRGNGDVEEAPIFSDRLLRWISAKGILILEHEIILIRVSDSTPIPILGGSVKTDEDSWLWQFNAVVGSRAIAKLVDPNEIGTPVEVQLNIDGYRWQFLIERITESYQYGEGTYALYGRSVAAELDEPYAPKVTKTFDALTSGQGIVANELSTTAWGITWSVLESAGWQIPADTFSITDATIAKILAEVIKACGGVFRAHPWERNLEFVYRFPTSPAQWEIDDPDEILHTGIILNQSIDADPQPCYNYVIVAGKANGVMVHVMRSGTPYDVPAPAVTDPLITTMQVGRERGRNILDETGYNRTRAVLDLPLPHADSGDRPILLTPGKVVQVDDLFGNHFRGKVTSTEVKFSLPEVTMTVEVARFFT